MSHKPTLKKDYMTINNTKKESDDFFASLF